MIDFLYSFLNFLQPGILWPEVAAYRPMLVIAVVAGVTAMRGRSATYSMSEAFRHPAFVYLCGFTLVQTASLYYGGIGEMLGTFGFWHVYLLFVAIAAYRLDTVEGLRRFIWGMIVGSMVIVGYGIYAVYAHLPAAVGGRAGAYGMYENHNDYSFIIIMVLPFIFMVRRQEAGFLRRSLLGLSLLACVLGIFLSLSRGGVLALVLELSMLVVVGFTGRARVYLIAMTLLFGVGAVGYQWAKRSENQGSSYTAEDAESSRFELWKAGWNMVKANPILGVGSRHFAEFSREYGEISHDQLGKNSHNTYIEVAATSGLAGLLTFVLMLRAMIRELRTKIRVPGHEWLDGIRQAALVSICSILFRALLDAKPWDWSFYVLCSIAISFGMFRRGIERAEEEAAGGGGTPGFVAASSRGASGGLPS
jgi:O-antigen ligase